MKPTMEGVTTMAEMDEVYARSLEELYQNGVERGVQQSQVRIFRSLAARRFGEETAEQLAGLLDELTSPERIDEFTDALFECGEGEEFIERMRQA